jgi:4'-phosphopantetheinyl transferase
MSSITLWLADGRNLQDDDITRLTAQLGPAELVRHARFMLPQRQRQFVIGRMLLRLAVSRLTGCSPSAIEVIERQNNAPQLCLPVQAESTADSAYSVPCFNLSHSRHWVACAVSLDTPVGVDIEWLDMQRDLLEISKFAFHPAEHAWLEQQPEPQRTACFYQMWSIKEALYKLWFNSVGTIALPSLVDAAGQFVMQGEQWYGFTVPHAECALALCSAQSAPNIVTVIADALLLARVEFP